MVLDTTKYWTVQVLNFNIIVIHLPSLCSCKIKLSAYVFSIVYIDWKGSIIITHCASYLKQSYIALFNATTVVYCMYTGPTKLERAHYTVTTYQHSPQ